MVLLLGVANAEEIALPWIMVLGESAMVRGRATTVDELRRGIPRGSELPMPDEAMCTRDTLDKHHTGVG